MFDIEEAVREEKRELHDEFVLEAFKKAWELWDSLRDLLDLLNNPAIQSYLDDIYRDDLIELRTMVPAAKRQAHIRRNKSESLQFGQNEETNE